MESLRVRLKHPSDILPEDQGKVAISLQSERPRILSFQKYHLNFKVSIKEIYIN